MAVVAGMFLALVAPAEPAFAFGLLPPAEPANTPTPYFTACHGSPAEQAVSVSCTSQVVDAIDAQHTAEGIAPLLLPANFTSEPVTRQLMQVIGAERASRGLNTPVGLVTSYDRVAQAGADRNDDPTPPADMGGGGSIWAGGMSTPLEADFGWMYDDGPGGHNLKCMSGDMSGCWGHRNVILDLHLQRPPAGFYLGAAYAVGGHGGGSYAALLAAPLASQPVAVPYQDPGEQPFAPRAVPPPAAHPPSGLQVRPLWYGSEPVRAGLVIALIVGISLAARWRLWRLPVRRRPRRSRPLAHRARSESAWPRSQPIIRPLDDGPGPWC